MAPNWKPDEVAAACRAYANATNNGEVGADQDVEKFNKDIVEKLQSLAPADCRPGSYHHRGDRVYPYLRDNVFGDIQKFQRAIRMVNLSEPSGVTEQQELNMAVAIHLKKASKMEYEFRDFEPTQWRFYLSYLQLKHLSKFQVTQQSTIVDIESQEAVSDLEQPTAGSTTSDSGSPVTAEAHTHHEQARGGGRGRTHTKRAKVEQERDQRKRKRDEDRDKKLDAMISGMDEMRKLIQQKAMASILTKAAAATTDPQQKQELQEKLVKLAMEAL